MSNSEIQRDLGRLESKVDILIERSEKVEDDSAKFHDRLTKVENAYGTVKVAATAVASGVAFVATLVVNFFATYRP